MWIVLIIGDRRGALPTIMAEADKETLIDGGDNFRAADAGDYAHPAGPRGTAAVETDKGGCSRGYLQGSVATLATDAPLHGVFGDATAGPSVRLINATADETIRPQSVCGTEQFLIVTSGSLTIDTAEYRSGDMRVQRADEPMPELVAGPDGCELTLVIADRRHQPVESG
ncbi:hypothetical protein [Mycolicibacterium porcinum]|uniref:Uncharacterized protein n=1 Tax=Mycolicibacterium porcinum TaxID=39693 RepID=A0AAW5T066_9MYCO|nr:hypothetical protein [Mycolicibacterium porcinum]MCV7388073.1 hypothetical protein [Mycolicibacterium porcinum]ORB43401.1 hypothetical protein BST41_04470 [Mycolicibacterium porcinum]